MPFWLQFERPSESSANGKAPQCSTDGRMMSLLAGYTKFLIEEEGAIMSEFQERVRVVARVRQLDIKPAWCMAHTTTTWLLQSVNSRRAAMHMPAELGQRNWKLLVHETATTGATWQGRIRHGSANRLR